MKNMKRWVLNKWRSRSVGQQECVGDKMDMPARDRAGTGNHGTSTVAGEVVAPGVTLFVLPNPIQVNSVDKAIGRTVEIYFIRFNRRLFGK